MCSSSAQRFYHPTNTPEGFLNKGKPKCDDIDRYKTCLSSFQVLHPLLGSVEYIEFNYQDFILWKMELLPYILCFTPEWCLSWTHGSQLTAIGLQGFHFPNLISQTYKLLHATTAHTMSMKLLQEIKETTEKLELLTSGTRFKTPKFGPRLDGIVTWSIWWRWRSVAYMHQVQYMNKMSFEFTPFQLFPIHHFRFFSRTNRPQNSAI